MIAPQGLEIRERVLWLFEETHDVTKPTRSKSFRDPKVLLNKKLMFDKWMKYIYILWGFPHIETEPQTNLGMVIFATLTPNAP